MTEGVEPMVEPREYHLDSCVRGYHVYQTVWSPAEGEILTCSRETTNPRDPYAVVVQKSEQRQIIVGHLPRRISRLCSLFLGKGGSIRAVVAGKRRYSADLPQGGLEIPCRLTFTGAGDLLTKAKNLIDALQLSENDNKAIVGHIKEEKETSVSKMDEDGQDISLSELKTNVVDVQDQDAFRASFREDKSSTIWSQYGRHTLSVIEKVIISSGQRLTDNHLHFVQALLKDQFPDICGLNNTLTLNKAQSGSSLKSNGLQIIFCRSDHWIVASTINCKPNVVNIYDSIYKDVDSDTRVLLAHLVGITEDHLQINMEEITRQTGGADCGVFAAAVITSLAHGHRAPFYFCQRELRTHLMECIEKCMLSPFPTTS